MRSLIGACFLVTGAARAETRFVAPLSAECSPPTTGSGTLADPWTNLYYAVTRGGLLPGDTLQLRGGDYYVQASDFPSGDTETERWSGCIGSNGPGGAKSVMPLLRDYLAGTEQDPIVIENYPGEVAHLTGTSHHFFQTGWTRCDPPNANTWYIHHNDGSSANPQLWFDYDWTTTPPTFATQLLRADSPGWSGGGSCPSMTPGTFAQDTGPDEIVVHMVADEDPNNSNWILGIQGGSGAAVVVVAQTRHVTVRSHPAGGKLVISGGRYGILMDDDAPQSAQGTDGSEATGMLFDGLLVGNVGSSDYGIGIISRQGTNNTVQRSEVGYTMAELVGPYCGDTSQRGGSNCVGQHYLDNYLHHGGRGWTEFGRGLGTALGHGIIARNCSGCTFAGNTVHDTYRNGISISIAPQGPCVSDPGGCQSDDIIIERNLISRWGFFNPSPGTASTTCMTDSAGVYVTTNGDNAGSVDGTIIRNNMFLRGCDLAGASPAIKISGSGTPTLRNWVVAYNSFSSDQRGANVDTNENDAYQATGTIVGNSMVAGEMPCNGHVVCALYTESGAQPTTADNNYWAPTVDTHVVKVGGTAFTRANATDYEPGARTLVPDYLTPTDLHLNPGSPLRDGGDCGRTGVPVLDFDLELRDCGDQRCDIGADEVASCSDNTVPSPPQGLSVN